MQVNAYSAVSVVNRQPQNAGTAGVRQAYDNAPQRAANAEYDMVSFSPRSEAPKTVDARGFEQGTMNLKFGELTTALKNAPQSPMQAKSGFFKLTL